MTRAVTSEIGPSGSGTQRRFSQSVHWRSPTRILTDRILGSLKWKVSLCGQRRLRSACADAQADLSLRFAHM